MSCVKHFYSRGAYLVLLWICLLSTAAWLLFRLYRALFQGLKDAGTYHQLALLPVVPLFICAPIPGWLAEARFGYFKVFRAACCMLLVASIAGCISVLLLESYKHETNTLLSHVLSGGVAPMVYAIGLIGAAAGSMTLLQVGLDQMPDASATNITSFITWFVFFMFAGCWLADVLYTWLANCNTNWTIQLFSLLPTICTSLTCCSMFLLPSKFVVTQLQSPNAIKTIYQVLKFAAKHKAPINRSALTYWEEDVPSRLDWEEDVPSRLDRGKTKYGGPFTTEQVEDVKTFFKMLILLLPLLIISLATSSTQRLYMYDTFNMSNCTSQLVYNFSYSPWMSGVIATIAYEFAIYPLIRNRLPSTLKQIGISSFLITLGTIVYLIATVTTYFLSDDIIIIKSSLHIAYCAFFGTASLSMMNSMLKFVCAQSPYSMRGVLTGYTIFVFFISMALGVLLFTLFYSGSVCDSTVEYCHLIHISLSTALSVIGLVLYYFLARWYKWRVRDEAGYVHSGLSINT